MLWNRSYSSRSFICFFGCSAGACAAHGFCATGQSRNRVKKQNVSFLNIAPPLQPRGPFILDSTGGLFGSPPLKSYRKSVKGGVYSTENPDGKAAAKQNPSSRRRLPRLEPHAPAAPAAGGPRSATIPGFDHGRISCLDATWIWDSLSFT